MSVTVVRHVLVGIKVAIAARTFSFISKPEIAWCLSKVDHKNVSWTRLPLMQIEIIVFRCGYIILVSEMVWNIFLHDRSFKEICHINHFRFYIELFVNNESFEIIVVIYSTADNWSSLGRWLNHFHYLKTRDNMNDLYLISVSTIRIENKNHVGIGRIEKISYRHIEMVEWIDGTHLILHRWAGDFDVEKPTRLRHYHSDNRFCFFFFSNLLTEIHIHSLS